MTVTDEMEKLQNEVDVTSFTLQAQHLPEEGIL
jgi:hypothetical protein